MHACEAKDFAQWRAAARPLIATCVEPTDVVWSDWKQPSLFADGAGSDEAQTGASAVVRTPSIPRELLALLGELALYRDASRWDLMYRLTWRVLYENRHLLENDADPDVQTARQWSKAVHRDVHKMRAFVRFHETTSVEGAAPDTSHGSSRNTKFSAASRRSSSSDSRTCIG